MSDPKYISKNNGIYHIDGYRVPDSEPLMVMRGKDIGALSAILDYISMLEDQPKNPTIDSHLKSSLERLHAFYLYQINNPDLQSVGCSRKSHTNTHLFILMSEEKLKKYKLIKR